MSKESLRLRIAELEEAIDPPLHRLGDSQLKGLVFDNFKVAVAQGRISREQAIRELKSVYAGGNDYWQQNAYHEIEEAFSEES